MALYKEHSALHIGKNEARQKYKQETANVGTNVFSATVWRQAQIPPLSTELATHSRA